MSEPLANNHTDGFVKSGVKITRCDFERILTITGAKTMASVKRPLGRALFTPPLTKYKESKACREPGPDVKTIRSSVSAHEALSDVFELNSMRPEDKVVDVLRECQKYI